VDLPLDLISIRIVAEALGLGLMVGIERYRGRGPGERRSAGVRTFAIFALLGAVCSLFQSLPLTLSVFGAVALLVIVGYYKSAEDSPGLTTETAALLVFWLGALLSTHETLAIGTAIVLTIVLASKGALHEFARDRVSEAEFFDTLKLLAIVLVVYPLLPDTRLGPYGFLNPHQAWLMVILVSAIGYVGYFLIRWLGPNRGLRLNALAGGLVSTPAATLSLASRARKAPPDQLGAYSVATVIANAAQFPRLLLLVAIANADLGKFLAAPLLAMTAAGFLVAWLAALRFGSNDDHEHLRMSNPFSLTPALKFAAFYVGILLLVEVAEAWAGARGAYLASVIGGLGSVSAVALSLAAQVGREVMTPAVAAGAMLLGLAANALVKIVLAGIYGTRPLALRLAAGLALMLAAGAIVLALL
jgi:uncharacterized membrane protein (DUF4010 family)